jgi:hypothetical protein
MGMSRAGLSEEILEVIRVKREDEVQMDSEC